MLNFYRWFIPSAAEDQAKLDDVLEGTKIKSKTQLETKINWTRMSKKHSATAKTVCHEPLY